MRFGTLPLYRLAMSTFPLVAVLFPLVRLIAQTGDRRATAIGVGLIACLKCVAGTSFAYELFTHPLLRFKTTLGTNRSLFPKLQVQHDPGQCLRTRSRLIRICERFGADDDHFNARSWTRACFVRPLIPQIHLRLFFTNLPHRSSVQVRFLPSLYKKDIWAGI